MKQIPFSTPKKDAVREVLCPRGIYHHLLLHKPALDFISPLNTDFDFACSAASLAGTRLIAAAASPRVSHSFECAPSGNTFRVFSAGPAHRQPKGRTR